MYAIRSYYALDGQNIKVEGPKGRLERAIHENVEVKVEADQLLVSARTDLPNTALLGLTRSLIANMCDGVTAGFSRVLEINGVGYRAEMKGSVLNLSLGYSHPVITSYSIHYTKLYDDFFGV